MKWDDNIHLSAKDGNLAAVQEVGTHVKQFIRDTSLFYRLGLESPRPDSDLLLPYYLYWCRYTSMMNEPRKIHHQQFMYH